MNPFINPITGLPFIKKYLTVPKRLYIKTPEKINKIREKSFKKILKYAYTIPVYHKKYKEAGIKPDDVKGLKDISKLPYINKKDFLEYYPDGLMPKNYNKKNLKVLSTSGSTGKPVSFYMDFPTISAAICYTSIRQSVVYKYNWRKIRIANLGNFSEGKADNVVDDILVSKSSRFWSNNYIKLNAFDDVKKMIDILNDFKPGYIVTYPVTLQQLAYFKRKGYADGINPYVLISSGYVLDEYTRNYVEDAFGCRVLNAYTSAESIADVAFECYDGSWHINYDAFHIEAVDEDLNVVEPGEKGHIIITRLFGKATPFIRYTGMDDWVTIIDEYVCECGLKTPILKNGVEGRQSTSVVLPNGEVIPAASFAIITSILKDLKTYKVTQFQIVQRKIDDIEIKIVIDEDLRDKGPSVEVIINKIKQVYQDRCGPDVNIHVKEVKKIKSPVGKPLPLVISNVKPEDGFKKTEYSSFKK